jgi:putative nucleotidyltransferase-like protein
MEGWMPADRDSCKLLCAIARYPSGDPTQQIYQLVDKVRDWDSLLRLAQEHRVLPMLFSRFANMGPAVPPAAQERLQAEYHRNVFHCLANTVELISVLEAFDHERIPAMPFKGVVLAASIYHNLTARSAGDLDLLIHYNDLVRATVILQKRGYELKTPVHPDKTPAVPDHYEYHFERQTDGMVLELRWRLELTQPRFRRNLGMDWVWPRRRTAIVAGTEVPDMNSETKLLVLCMHGSKHIWSRLIWICDVAQLLNASPDLDWQEVIEEAKRSGLWRALALGILLAHRVAGAAVPQATLRRFESDTTARRLAQLIQDNLFDAPCSPPPGRMPYNVQLLGFEDRLKMLLSPDFLQPNARDRAAIPLPKSLYALYYLIRPFRILWDRSAR